MPIQAQLTMCDQYRCTRLIADVCQETPPVKWLTGKGRLNHRHEVEMKGSDTGFTFMEMMMVIAIIAILSSFATPNVISWRKDYKLKGAYENMRADLKLAQARALRERAPVSVVFSSNRYDIFLDNGAGGGSEGNYSRDGSEPLVRLRKLPAGVTIDLAATTIAGDRTQFEARGRCLATGTVVVRDDRGHQQMININPLGRIWLN
jgi:prepilin-type N-terminal cleavage/methylation domain-containing protein